MKIKRAIILVFLSFILLSFPGFPKSNAQTTQIYFGAWVSDASDGHIGNLHATQAFASSAGKQLSIWDWIQLWNRPDDSDNIAEFDTTQMDACRNAGMIPMVSWGPESGWPQFPFYNLDSIIDGSQDSYLNTWFNAAKQWNHPFFVRMFWEFTGSWTWDSVSQTGVYPWGGTNTPAKFVQAWRHVVNLARQDGANDITWVWCPAGPDSVATLRSCYPGDNYVDWVSADIYGTRVGGAASYINQMFSSIRTVAPSKPCMISEMGYKNGDWATFLRSTMPNQLSYIKAICLWQGDGFNMVTTNIASGLSSSYYASNSFSSISADPIRPIGVIVTPTPAVPELSLLVVVPLLLSLFSVVVLLKHRKIAKPNQ